MAHSIACDPARERSKTALRKALLATRQQLADDHLRNTRLSDHIVSLLVARAPKCVGAYWPIAGEFDIRPALIQWFTARNDADAALPVITSRDAPMVFHRWRPGDPVREGQFRIPVPQAEVVIEPDLLLIPCVGIDDSRFRLGYGGGFYDRTLAAFDARGEARPFTVGVAFDAGRIDAIPREMHDIALDMAVTESGIW